MNKILKTALAVSVMALAVACCGQNSQREAAKEETKGMIRLNVTVTADPEHLGEVIDGLNRLAAASRLENGCIGYDIFQNTVDPLSLIIVETWVDQASLDAHGQTEHYKTIPRSLQGKMKTELQRFDF